MSSAALAVRAKKKCCSGWGELKEVTQQAMLFMAKKVPLNWYRHEVQFSIELLRSYVQNVEDQISNSIEEYRTGCEMHMTELFYFFRY